LKPALITTSLGDTLEWIDGNAGYVTQPTVHDLVKAIYRIILDEGLREKFSKNCMEIVKSEFSIEKVVGKLEKVYEKAVEK
jgi:glycosyltransferase involved in cell wall biosynthesis